MARSYDNWERLVTATLRREQLRLVGQRTPSEVTLASLSSFSSFDLGYSSRRVSSFNFSSLLVGDSFLYSQILQATDYLSDAKLMKHGRSGDLFYGVLEGGTPVVVKKIDVSSVNKESLFISELEIFGKVSHHGFVPLLGHCLENANEKFLVYKHMSNKDLSSSLSRKIVSDNGRQLPFLDWITRLKIATEVAETLSYLHHQCVPPLAHRDIQASSILLDDNFEVRLGSLYEVRAEEKDIRTNAVARFLRLPKLLTRAFEQGTFGISNASYASCSYDVSSLGKVLIELVTGKLGLSAIDDSIINDWMASVLAYILPDDAELIVNIMDPSLVIAKHSLAQAWAVALIAKACLCRESSKRPRMAQILLALEHIKSARFTNENLKPTGNHVSVALEIVEILRGSKIVGRTPQATAYTTTLGSGTASGNHGISEAGGIEETYSNWGIFYNPSLTIFSYSKIMVATRNFESDAVEREVLLGRTHQARLQEKFVSKSDSGSLVAVRKLNSESMVLLEDWQSRLSLLGRLCHPNLVKFLGHCVEKKKLFIVHEFMQSGSLENHLFGGSSDVQPLSWNIRLKILTGAARGLAYLHAAGRQGFYEYFGTSDILLDGSYNAKISGFGTTTLPDLSYLYGEVHPNLWNEFSDAPPENAEAMLWYTSFTDQSGMTVKGDVYGFGAVLVALLTGLSTKRKHRLSWGEIHPVIFFKNFKRNQLEKIMDPQLKGKYSLKAAEKIGDLASICLQYEPEFRPSMKQVVEVLERIGSAKE